MLRRKNALLLAVSLLVGTRITGIITVIRTARAEDETETIVIIKIIMIKIVPVVVGGLEKNNKI